MQSIVTLLRFFKYLLLIVGRTFQMQVLQELNVPQSIHGCRSLVGISHKPFKEFPVCPACHMLFDTDIRKLVEGTGRNRRLVKCDYIKFPNHPQARFRMPCGTVLLSMVKQNGNTSPEKCIASME